MNIVLLGLGSWGRRWLETLLAHPDITSLVVVDPAPAARELAAARGVTWKSDLPAALAHQRPDFAVNASPPEHHTPTNRLLIEQRIPVLCEKPIAPTLAEAAAVIAEARATGVPFIIAENMRRGGIPRTARRLVASGGLGEPLSIQCRFFRYYDEPKPYLVAQAYPLLEDVVIHYVDLALALAGAAPVRVEARGFNPGGGIFRGSPGLDLAVDFANGVRFTFGGNFATRGRSTPWLGEWRVEGTAASLEFDDGPLRLCVGEQLRLVPADPGVAVLDDFLVHLRHGTPIETSGHDYLPVQACILAGVQSCRENRPVLLSELT